MVPIFLLAPSRISNAAERQSKNAREEREERGAREQEKQRRKKAREARRKKAKVTNSMKRLKGSVRLNCLRYSDTRCTVCSGVFYVLFISCS